MADYHRLSALDRSFLDIEHRNTPMHVGAVCVFKNGPLQNTDGGIDIDRVRAYVAARLHRLPRYRQRIAHVPIEAHPVWVDAADFNLPYHVRHTALPRPGSERQLKRLAGRVFSQQLDRGKPLWELWIVEGLSDNRFAIITKAHHCMIDGLAGADMLGVLLSPDADEPTGTPHRWHPRREPDGATLIRDAALRRVTTPLRAASSYVRQSLAHPREALESAGEVLRGLRDVGAGMAQAASATPLNDPIGAHRRFDWEAMPLDDIRAIKNKLGGTVNDVVLAIVAGAAGRFFDHRGFRPHEEEDFAFRLFCPVGLARASGGKFVGNRVSAMSIEAPLDTDSPLRRLELIRERTAEAKTSAQSQGLEIIEHFADWAMPSLLGTLDELAATALTFNLVVTNVPGPQFPLYLAGARMLSGFPFVPLFRRQGLGIALLSYAGKLGWGFSADREVVPDLHDFMLAVDQSFIEMCEAAGLKPSHNETDQPEPTPLSAGAENKTTETDVCVPHES